MTLSRGRGWNNGLECDSKFVQCLIFLSWMTSCTVGIPRFLWIISLVTYHAASTVALNIFDWHLCMTAILDLQAHPHNSMPYVHIGAIMYLYSRSLLATDRCDFLPSNQWSSLCRSSVFVSWWYDPSSSTYYPSATLDTWRFKAKFFFDWTDQPSLLCCSWVKPDFGLEDAFSQIVQC